MSSCLVCHVSAFISLRLYVFVCISCSFLHLCTTCLILFRSFFRSFCLYRVLSYVYIVLYFVLSSFICLFFSRYSFSLFNSFVRSFWFIPFFLPLSQLSTQKIECQPKKTENDTLPAQRRIRSCIYRNAKCLRKGFVATGTR